MFEFDAGKLIIIGIVALIVIGPKDLPRVLRQAGQAMAKLRRMAAEFQSQFTEAMREAELSEIQEEAAKLAASSKIDVGFNPIAQLRSELTRAIDGAGATTSASSGGEANAAELPMVPDQAQNSILAPEGVEGRDGYGALPTEGAAAAERGEPAVTANQAGSAEGAALSHSGVDGESHEPSPLRDKVAPVSRT